MQTSLFSTESSNQSHLVTEDKIIQPLTQVLGEATQTSQETKSNPPLSIKKSLDELFPEQQVEEKSLKKAKEILGALADECTDEELKDIVTKTQYLCENWLDAFERSIFGERTLQELLHEKGGT